VHPYGELTGNFDKERYTDWGKRKGGSCHDCADDVDLHVHESDVEAGVAVGEP
jgi:hypothetical protein